MHVGLVGEMFKCFRFLRKIIRFDYSSTSSWSERLSKKSVLKVTKVNRLKVQAVAKQAIISMISSIFKRW